MALATTVKYDVSEPWTIGANGPTYRANGFPRTWAGVIDDVGIYNRVLSATDVERPFDARRSARGKRYGYVIDEAEIAMPLMLRYAWHVGAPLDVGAMRVALRRLRGRQLDQHRAPGIGAGAAGQGRTRQEDQGRASKEMRHRRSGLVETESSGREVG